MIFVIDDDEIMARCIAKAVGERAHIFTNAIEAMGAIAGGDIPRLIFLDVLLDGPDGFTFLNEMCSYMDTAQIPVVLVSSLDLRQEELSGYGVVGVLLKEEMKPEDIKRYVEQYT